MVVRSRALGLLMPTDTAPSMAGECANDPAFSDRSIPAFADHARKLAAQGSEPGDPGEVATGNSVISARLDVPNRSSMTVA